MLSRACAQQLPKGGSGWWLWELQVRRAPGKRKAKLTTAEPEYLEGQ